MKLLMGLVGGQGAGKETVGAAIARLLEADGISHEHARFSDVLRETLTIWDIPHGRDNEQLLAKVMAAPEAFKDGALTRATARRIAQSDKDVVILDGIRWLSDEAMVRSFPHAVIAYVVANPEVRYQRVRVRNRSGAGELSWEDFYRQEQVITEVHIADIGSRADVVLPNEGSRADLQARVLSLYAERLRPVLAL